MAHRLEGEDMCGTSSRWLSKLPIAAALERYEPDDPLELGFERGECIAIAGKRDGGAWLTGFLVSSSTWGLVPAHLVSIVELNHSVARRELHEYYFRHHREKISKLDALLLSTADSCQALDAVYTNIQASFQHTVLCEITASKCILESPRQTTSTETSIEFTWATRELYELDLNEPRRGKTYCIAVCMQDSMMTEDSDSWTRMLPGDIAVSSVKSALQCSLRYIDGVTHAKISGVLPGATYRARLCLWDIADSCEIATSSVVNSTSMALSSIRRRSSARLEENELVQLLRLKERHGSPVKGKLLTPPRSRKAPQSRPPLSPKAPLVPPRSADSKRRHSSMRISDSPPLPPRDINQRRGSLPNKGKPAPPILPRRPKSVSQAVPSFAKYVKSLHYGFEELLSTEAHYVENLRFIVDHIICALKPGSNKVSTLLFNGVLKPKFLEDLRSSLVLEQDSESMIAHANVIRSLFLNLEMLVGVNNELLAGLKKISSSEYTTKESGEKSNNHNQSAEFEEMCCLWTEVASLVINTWPFFRCYKEYAVGHADRISKLKNGDLNEKYLKGKAKLRRFILESLVFFKVVSNGSTVSQSENKDLDLSILEAELIKPVQRILKYELFIRDALQTTQKAVRDVIQDDSDSRCISAAESTMNHLEEALAAIKSVSEEVNEALSQNERSLKCVSLWVRLGRSPGDLVKPGRELLHLCVVECSPGMDTLNRGVAYGKRKEYLVAVMSDILLFARPNKGGLFSSSGNLIEDDGRPVDANLKNDDKSPGTLEKNTWVVSEFNPHRDNPTHHPKHITLIEHLDVSSSVYSSTQNRGDCGLDIRVLGKPDTTRGESPYRAYAVWCETPRERDKLREIIQEALQAHLHAFFSRKIARPSLND